MDRASFGWQASKACSGVAAKADLPHPYNSRDGLSTPRLDRPGGCRRHLRDEASQRLVAGTSRLAIPTRVLSRVCRAALSRRWTDWVGLEVQPWVVPRHHVGGRPGVVASRSRSRMSAARDLLGTTSAATSDTTVARVLCREVDECQTRSR